MAKRVASQICKLSLAPSFPKSVLSVPSHPSTSRTHAHISTNAQGIMVKEAALVKEKEQVTITSATTVAPAQAQKEHRLPLSNLDHLLPPFYVSVFFCYRHPAPTAVELKEALAKVLAAYYPLAGVVVANAGGEPELLCNGRGVDFAEATAHGQELRDLQLYRPDGSVLKLVPKKTTGVMAVQVTEFKCGGAVVWCSFDHRVSDAYSFNMFLVAWAAAARGGSVSPIPSFDRSLVAPSRPPPPRTNSQLVESIFAVTSYDEEPPAKGSTAVNRLYRVSAADVAALQAAAGPGRSKFMSFTAHLWQLYARAASPRGRPCCMGVVVDGRARLREDGAMSAYFGNVLTFPYGIVGAADLRRMTLADAAADVQRWVAEAATGEHFCDVVDWVEGVRPRPIASRAYTGGDAGEEAATCIVSSGTRFPVGEMDFGWGRPAFGSYHFSWPSDTGYIMPMPSARGDGDWVVYVHATPEVVKVMEEEEPTVFKALESSYAFE